MPRPRFVRSPRRTRAARAPMLALGVIAASLAVHFEPQAILVGIAAQRDQPIAVHDFSRVGFHAIGDKAQHRHGDVQASFDPSDIGAAVDGVGVSADFAVKRVQH